VKRQSTIILHGSTSQKTILNYKFYSLHFSTNINGVVKKAGCDWRNIRHLETTHMEYNIKMYLKIWCESVDWIQLAQDKFQWQALVNREINLSGSTECGGFLDVGDSSIS
jgi:hypothetical protein